MSDKVKINLNPASLQSLQYFRSHIEMFTYSKEIKRYRPLIRV